MSVSQISHDHSKLPNKRGSILYSGMPHSVPVWIRILPSNGTLLSHLSAKLFRRKNNVFLCLSTCCEFWMWKLAKTDLKNVNFATLDLFLLNSALGKETTQFYFKRFISCRDIDENCMLFLLWQPVQQSQCAFLLRCDWQVQHVYTTVHFPLVSKSTNMGLIIGNICTQTPVYYLRQGGYIIVVVCLFVR